MIPIINLVTLGLGLLFLFPEYNYHYNFNGVTGPGPTGLTNEDVQAIVEIALALSACFIVKEILVEGPQSPKVKALLPTLKIQDTKVYLLYPLIPHKSFFLGVGVGRDIYTMHTYAGLYFRCDIPDLADLFSLKGTDVWIFDIHIGKL